MVDFIAQGLCRAVKRRPNVLLRQPADQSVIAGVGKHLCQMKSLLGCQIHPATWSKTSQPRKLQQTVY